MYKNKIELNGRKLPVGFLQNNIDKVSKKQNLPNNHKITKTLLSQRLSTGNHRVPYGQGKGFPAPLLKTKDFFNLIIAVSKCYHPIRVSNALQLINILISNTEIR